MNIMKKMLPVLLCVMMVVVMFAVTTYAANGQTNIGMDVSATTVNVDDTFTITVYYDDMNVASFGCTLQFDANLVELVSVVGCDEEVPEDIGLCRGKKFDDAEVSSIEDANTNGQIGLIVVNMSDKDYDACDIYTATFRAKASGDVTFTLTEKSSNVTFGVGDGFGGVAATQTVTIAGSEPVCEHTETKLVCKDEGKHDIVCANDACGEIIDTVDCGGENTIYTDNGDWTHKKACKCGHLFEEAISHDFEDGKCACGLEHEHDYSFNSYYEPHYSNPFTHRFVTECVCGACERGEESRHVDANHDGRCDLCNSSDVSVVHSHDHYEFNETQHWSVCSCGATVDESVTHEYTYDCDTSCNICDYEREADHEYFYACDQACMLCHKVTNPGAEHSLDHVDANPATCTENGNVEYWYCSDCGASWLDEAMTESCNRFTVTLAASCKYGATHTEGVEAGCHYTGMAEYWYCANCDVFYQDAECTIVTNYKTLLIPALKTTAEYVPAKEATCTEAGNVEYWTCYECEQFWFDAALTQLTTLKAVKIGVDADNHTEEADYTNNGENHTVTYPCCQATATDDHTYDATTHKCVCGDVEKFTLQVIDMADRLNEYSVEYGTNVLAFLNSIQADLNMNDVSVENETYIGCYSWTGDWIDIDEDTLMTGGTQASPSSVFTGWTRMTEDDVWGYDVENTPVYGWYQVDGSWYYFFINEETGWSCRAEGLTRVPYPTATINGVTYGPKYDQGLWEDYDDAGFQTEGYFVFGEDGKFQFAYNGEYMDGQNMRYAVNGEIVWHYGMAKIDNAYYYFIGDVEGGNIAATGEVYISYTNDLEGFQVGGLYTFGADGKLLSKRGIVEEDGKLFYYVNNVKQIGTGLTAVDGGWIYVRSNGELAKGIYYVGDAKYDFGTNGIATELKNGIIGDVYYVNGHIAYGAGLVELEDGSIIYVRSNGQIVKDQAYWVTNVGNTNMVPGKYMFDENGIMQPVKNGIVPENDGLYMYSYNHIKYGAGLVEIEEGVYVYVRSNGQLAIGEYWVTNSNEEVTGMKAGKYTFGEDGKLIIE